MGRAALWGFVIGTALMTVLLMLGLASTDTDDDQLWAASFIAAGMVGAMVGGIPASLIGLVVGAVRRRSRPALPPPLPHLPPPPPPPPPVNDRWSAMVGRCELAVRRAHAAVAAVPASPAREWLERIAGQFGGELSAVRRIADLGRALGADQNHPVSRRMSATVRDFTSFEDEVGRVALQMLDQTSLDAVRSHLEVLEQQLPHLGNG
ncbi:hypothetical protein ACRAKI_34170 [Saccharothrix isguenensis]